MKNNIISIIVPIYNSENKLSECLDSILNQSYKKLEIILINDGSKDRSLEICKKYKSVDNRFIVIDNENHGVSYSRNCGIRKASGKYVMFIDSDDVIDKNMCEFLLENLEKYNAELSCCSFDEKEENFDFKYDDNISISINNFYKLLLENYKGFLWNKLYIRKILIDNEIVFNNSISSGEDLLFNVEYMKYVNRTVYTNSKLYGYRISSNSLSRKYSSTWFDIIKVYNIIINDQNIDDSSIDSYVCMYLIILFQAMYRCKKMNLSIDNMFERYNIDYKNEIRCYYFNTLFSKNTNLLMKIKLILYRYFPVLLYFTKNDKK